ncbi:MAG: hypothetical protein IRZ10_09630 [Thermoflavifilum sp.]|nr:hypothetical protein [Thermoflavifilum sp.]MCL6514667.1 hypothetical protein [Alicyclobacillus sp.]
MGLSAASGVAWAGTAWQSFAGALPRFQQAAIISHDVNQNNSYAQAKLSNVGGDYKLNMNVYDATNNKQVSATYEGADDGTLANFNLDSSSLGHTVNLVAWTANWTVVQVEYSGQFRADS